MTTQTIGRTSRSTSTIFATTAIACYTYFVLALLLMHVLRPDYTPTSHMISDYAVGPYGWIMTTAFLALSGASLMLLLGLARSGPRSVAARLGTLLLGIASLGLLVSAIFPTDLDGTSSTRTGDIHNFSFLVNVGCIMLASVLLSAAVYTAATQNSTMATWNSTAIAARPVAANSPFR